uniref:3-hydroxyisobutyryl-CoA hydrolase, mitochondrial n=1 Tax=Anopheles dirus TaxID=7168 RepID=A0A182N5K7_9DIPT
MDTVRRTEGDGMENDELVGTFTGKRASTSSTVSSTPMSSGDIKLPANFSIERLLPHSGPNPVYRPTELVTGGNTSLAPIVPRGKVFNLVPRLVAPAGGRPKLSTIHSKEPKFVPFEPYKGAVTPIIPGRNSMPGGGTRVKLTNRNNLDLSVLVSQMSTITDKELRSAAPPLCDDGDKPRYEKQLEELRKERDYFQGQLKFQAQVNSELKNLLVAAVGEDLQTKVNVLTEDKLHLARKLLNSAENLSSHTEQIEFLAGQSEVWRSKFLASSLMVEELARWKASLLQRNGLLLASNKEQLEVISKTRELTVDVLKHLRFLANAKEPLQLQSANVLDLASECVNISQQLALQHSALGMPDNLDGLKALESMTDAEKLAVEALQNSHQSLIPTDEAFRAIVGQAFPSIHAVKQQSDASLDFELVSKPDNDTYGSESNSTFQCNRQLRSIAIRAGLNRSAREVIAPSLCRTMSSTTGDASNRLVLTEDVGSKGVITLNRPKALNAINLEMVQLIYEAMKRWENSKHLVIIKSVGEKAFCAGGDVRAITEKGGEELAKKFFSTEYGVNALIGNYRPTYIAFIDGITMGGGVGLSVHGKYRIATERTMFAMPETAIGLFPDVGGGYFLPRLEGKLGLYLGLTGFRLKGRDVHKAGVATHYVESKNLPALEQQLLATTSNGEVESVLDRFSEKRDAGVEFVLAKQLPQINACFGAPTIEGIFANLERDGSEWAQKTLNLLHKMSPTSLVVTQKQLELGSKMDLKTCLKMEYRLAVHHAIDSDFREGVRAMLVDRDQNPRWNPATLAEVDPARIEKFFGPVPDGSELMFEEDGPKASL